MPYTQADAVTAARRVKEAQERIELLTVSIECSRTRGQPTDLAEGTLLTMLQSLELMVQDQERIQRALARGNPVHFDASHPS